MLKLSENPSIIPPTINSISEFYGQWWVAYTKSRFEKVFARELYNRHIDYFLPMREKIIFSGGRKRRVMLPLFTSYVFFCGDEIARYTAMATGRLCHIVEVEAQDKFIKELLVIEKAIQNRMVIDNYPRLAVGCRCRVKGGPMIGTEGVVVQKDIYKSHMVIQIDILGQGVLVEIDNDLLEPV